MIRLPLSFLIITCICILNEQVFSQNDDYFTIEKDVASIYLRCNGVVCLKKKAMYKRVARFDKSRLNFYGEVNDYYMDGKIACRAFYKDGLLNGEFTRYYSNGTIEEKGYYTNGNRDSSWSFYYRNGNLEKEIDFKNQQLKLMKFYKKNGKPVFTDGNGTYKGLVNKDFASCDELPIKGVVKDGLMEGKWTINFGYSSSTEIYEGGKFIRGHEDTYNRTYDNNPNINIIGYPYYEGISLIDILLNSNTEDAKSYYPKYNDSIFFVSFIEDLRRGIKTSLVKNDNFFFYALTKFEIQNGRINPESYQSITNQSTKADELKKLILSLNKWNKSENNTVFTVYLPLFWENEKIYIVPSDLRYFND